jgi:hypothetical protein
MCTSWEIQSAAASFDDGASARLATSPNSTRSNGELPRRIARSLVITVSMPSRCHSPSSTSVPPSGRELMKLRSDPAVARSAAAGSSSRARDTISRSIAAVST